MKRMLVRAILVTVFVAAVFVCGSSHVAAATAVKPGPSSKVILEVMNRYFTVGEKIPSIYLRVFSDGSAECHAEKFWDEADTVKKKGLSHEDFDQLRGLVGQPELLSVKPRYELMERVIDSWMEWTINVPHGRNVQRIEVANFSPVAAKNAESHIQTCWRSWAVQYRRREVMCTATKWQQAKRIELAAMRFSEFVNYLKLMHQHCMRNGERNAENGGDDDR
jgi:hypothetical protein